MHVPSLARSDSLGAPDDASEAQHVFLHRPPTSRLSGGEHHSARTSVGSAPHRLQRSNSLLSRRHAGQQWWWTCPRPDDDCDLCYDAVLVDSTDRCLSTGYPCGLGRQAIAIFPLLTAALSPSQAPRDRRGSPVGTNGRMHCQIRKRLPSSDGILSLSR